MAEWATKEWAGALSERMGLEHWLPERDAAGADVGRWQAAGAVQAAVSAVAGGEAVRGDARVSGRRWRVRLRARADVAITSRLLWRGERLVILQLLRDPGTPDRLELLCESRP